DAGFVEQVPQLLQHVGADVADAFLGIGDPAVDDEVDRAVAVAVEPNGRRRGLEHPRHALGRLDHQRFGLLDVAAVGYAHGNLDAHVAARVGPVLDLVDHQ